MLRLAKTLELLAAALKKLAIPYAIVGSVASSARGSYRATEDLDILASVVPDHAGQLADVLGRDWYADAAQIRDAVAAGRAFNLIYMPFSQKVDVFPAKDEFDAAQLKRATSLPLAALGTTAAYPVSTAEDIVVAKLERYKADGETSERQWTDILKVMRAATDIDWAWLEDWAQRKGAAHLLARAKSES